MSPDPEKRVRGQHSMELHDAGRLVSLLREKSMIRTSGVEDRSSTAELPCSPERKPLVQQPGTEAEVGGASIEYPARRTSLPDAPTGVVQFDRRDRECRGV